MCTQAYWGRSCSIIFINDLDAAASPAELLLKFADDTNISRVIKSDADCDGLQMALDKLMEWADTWGMAFNVKKCKVMHLGRTNTRHEYQMGGKQLAKTSEEKDLGVLVTDKLKPSVQCAQASRIAQVVLGQITRAFQYRDRGIFVRL
jgi:Reverse transcriptase (RNA-dependent DNA polymerase)